MSIAQISPASVQAPPATTQTEPKATPAQATQDVQKAAQTQKSDTVTISKQALQQLSSDGDTPAVEARETAAEKASEQLRSKK